MTVRYSARFVTWLSPSGLSLRVEDKP